MLCTRWVHLELILSSFFVTSSQGPAYPNSYHRRRKTLCINPQQNKKERALAWACAQELQITQKQKQNKGSSNSGGIFDSKPVRIPHRFFPRC